MTIPGMGWADVLEYRTPSGKDFFVADGVIETLETRPAYGGAAFIVKPAPGWDFRMDSGSNHYRSVMAHDYVGGPGFGCAICGRIELFHLLDRDQQASIEHVLNVLLRDGKESGDQVASSFDRSIGSKGTDEG